MGTGYSESAAASQSKGIAENSLDLSENVRKRSRVTKSQTSKRGAVKGKGIISESSADGQPVQVIENVVLSNK